MNQKKLNKLFELCDELYWEEQKKSGMTAPHTLLLGQKGKYKGFDYFFSIWILFYQNFKSFRKRIYSREFH